MNAPMKRPDFFILGAPKCGTTSLDAWLGAHPRIFTAPKEPDYFNRDPGDMNNLRQYESLFAAANDAHLAVGETSPKYLRHPHAVGNILRYNDAAKFIVMVRNPADMAMSWHAQQLRNDNEDVRDFETAWNLQYQRRAGDAMPRLCYDAANLLYGDVCALGKQLARVYEQAARERVHVVVFDDVVADPGRVYRAVLKFLQTPDDGRAVFDAHNPGRLPRFRYLNRKLSDAHAKLAQVKTAFGIRRSFNGGALLQRLKRLNSRADSRPPLRPEFRRALADYFADEVRLLESLLSRDLSHWRR